jgi:hypothetical protein
MIANLFDYELLLINIDLVVLVAKATEYDEPREPFFFPKAEVRK